ncbi:vitellogenin-6-like [Dermacentor albipictus]|uniref:vitellogenin-6-like n=1 Tax=Dermacentor albipictus TaxID=60249 RepID=UPI0038FC727C
MRVLCGLPLLLLAAAANGVLFDPVPPTQSSGGVVYKVRATVTLKSPELTVTEGAGLQYAGDLALYSAGQDTYEARFLNFSVVKHEHLYGGLDNLTAVPLNWSVPLLNETFAVDYSQQFRYPVKFVLSAGKVVKYEVSPEVAPWARNVYKSLLTLLQNQVETPQEVPTSAAYYEDGVSGYCRVTYEVHTLTRNLYTEGPVYNVTKTKYLDDCKQTRPVHKTWGPAYKGYYAVCAKHLPNNYLPGYQEDTSAHESKPLAGCPEGLSPYDSVVAAHEVSYYNVSGSLLESALTDSLTVLPLLSGSVVVRTRLQLELASLEVPPTTPVQYQGEPHTSLELHLPEAAEYLDLPVYSYLVGSSEQVKPEVFTQVLEQVAEELVSLELETEAKKTPALMLKLVHMVSLLNTDQLKQALPQSLLTKTTELEPKEQVLRALYVDLLGQAGSKSAVEVAVHLVKEQVLSLYDATRLFRQLSVFSAYVDKDTVELLLELCKTTETVLKPLVKVAVCDALGEVVKKACPTGAHWDTVHAASYKSSWRRIPKIKSRYEQTPSVPKYLLPFVPVERLVLPQEKQCTVADLVEYVKVLEEALKTTTDFKVLVGYLNALGKVAKPEVLPVLVSYLNGTAENLYQLVDEGEEVYETVYFVKKAVLLALSHVVEYFPKEVSPLVRTVLLNVSEPVDVRTLAFDVWLKSVPTKWDLQQVSLVVKLDRSLELKSYVYSALKSVLKDKHPANHVLASRVRGVFVHYEALNVGPRYSTYKKKTYYDVAKNLGFESVVKHVANNVSYFPTYLHAGLKYNLGPYVQTLLEGKLLLKGGEKFLNEVFSTEGTTTFLRRVTEAFTTKVKRPYSTTPYETSNKYSVVKELNLKTRRVESPKAVLFAKFLGGDAVLPLDKELFEQLKTELVELAQKAATTGPLTTHLVRVLLPKKVAHVEPTVVGLPVVQTVLHPIVVSLKLKDVSLQVDTTVDSLLPVTFNVTGTVQPLVLSVKQHRVFVPAELTEESPSVVHTNVKHLHFKTDLSLGFNKYEKEVKVAVKPTFGPALLSAVSTEHVVETPSPFLLLEKPAVDPKKVMDTIVKPFVYHRVYETKLVNLEVDAVSHGPFAPLPLYGKLYRLYSERMPKLLQYLSHQASKQHLLRINVKPYEKDPVSEWVATFKYENNLDYLMKTTLKKVYTAARTSTYDEEETSYEMLSEPVVTPRPTPYAAYEEEDSSEYYPEYPHLWNKTLVKHVLNVTLEGKLEGTVKKLTKLDLAYHHSLNKTLKHYYVDVKTLTRPLVSLFLNVSSPVPPSPFWYVPSYLGNDLMNATLYLTYGDEPEPFVVTYNATKTEDQLLGLHAYDATPLLHWFVPQCLADQHAGHTVSYACSLATVFDAHLNKQVVSFKVPSQVSPKVKNWALKVLSFLKFKLFPWASFYALPFVQQEEYEVVLTLNKTDVNPYVSVAYGELVLPGEKVVLNELKLSKYSVPNLLLSVWDRLKHGLYKSYPHQPCSVGKHWVRTYDNVSYPLEVRPHCKYLVTSDCSAKHDFAVVVQPLDLAVGTKKLIVQLGPTVVELPPPDLYKAEVLLTVNGTYYVANTTQDVVLPYKWDRKLLVTVYPTSGPHDPPVVQLTNTLKTFKLLFDGVNFFVWVNPLYQGKTCGLCSNYDNEPYHEFVTPENYLVSNYSEFVASYGFGLPQCKEPLVPVYPLHYLEELKKPVGYEAGYPSSPEYPSHSKYPSQHHKYPSRKEYPTHHKYPSHEEYPTHHKYPSHEEYPTHHKYPTHRQKYPVHKYPTHHEYPTHYKYPTHREYPPSREHYPYSPSLQREG